MRQGQQNRRGRGRSRKPQNPLARNYESNGPDVKIRGTASHVAEKYMSLARDALASGDMVTAESYLQHAEHYNRIIMAAQTQATSQPGAPQGDAPNGGSRPQSRWHSDSDEEGSESEESEAGGQGSDEQSGGGQGGGGHGGGSQDRQRHEGNREHHAGGRGRGRGRQGGNGADNVRDANGAEPAEADRLRRKRECSRHGELGARFFGLTDSLARYGAVCLACAASGTGSCVCSSTLSTSRIKG